jgi:hypothetical protein
MLTGSYKLIVIPPLCHFGALSSRC